MSTPAPVRARQSFRHEAFLWRDQADFVQTLAPFIQDGVDAGEAVLALLLPEHTDWIRSELGAAASQVQFVDVTELGRNPARIIPACQEFLRDWSGHGRPARGVGEPIWPGRRPEEILECQLHEALFNLAIDPDLPVWIICPYDAKHLDGEVIAEAGRSHPALSTPGSYQGSPSYRGQAHAQEMFTADLPPIGGRPVGTTVTGLTDLKAVAAYVSLHAALADLWSHRIVDLTDTVRGLAANSLNRGAGQVRVQLWDKSDVLICDLTDDIVIDDFLIGRRAPLTGGPDSLWLANQRCDLVQARSGKSGTTVRLHMRK